MTIKSMIATSAVALTLATTAMADANFTGYYLGGNLGFAAGTTKYNDNAVGDNTKHNIKVKGFVAGFHTGYQHQISAFVMGLEAFVSNGTTKGSKTVDGIKLESKRKFAFGLAARLGYAVNNWHFYTKLGWENAKFDFAIKTAGTTAFSKSKRSNGFVAGLGAETLLENGMTIGGEWTFTQYKKMSILIDGDKDSTRPRIHDFKIRLGYKF